MKLALALVAVLALAAPAAAQQFDPDYEQRNQRKSEERERYGLGFHLRATGDAAWLEGYDAGVSFVSLHEPSSETTTTISFSSELALTSTRPPGGVYFTAFSTRLENMEVSCVSLPYIV